MIDIKDIDYDTKLAVTEWVFKHIVDHGKEGGSFRYLIYNRLGFGPDAYVDLYTAGGMTITNEFDLSLKDNIIEAYKNNDDKKMKETLGLCDEPGCFNHITHGWTEKLRSESGIYRATCNEHKTK
jgi:hypothetical protein